MIEALLDQDLHPHLDKTDGRGSRDAEQSQGQLQAEELAAIEELVGRLRSSLALRHEPYQGRIDEG